MCENYTFSYKSCPVIFPELSPEISLNVGGDSMDQSQRLPHARSAALTRVITLNIAQSTKGYRTKNSIIKIFTFNKTSVCGICGVQHDVFHRGIAHNLQWPARWWGRSCNKRCRCLPLHNYYPHRALLFHIFRPTPILVPSRPHVSIIDPNIPHVQHISSDDLHLCESDQKDHNRMTMQDNEVSTCERKVSVKYKYIYRPYIYVSKGRVGAYLGGL